MLKFQMVTNPEGVPVGTDLWKKGQAGEKTEEGAVSKQISHEN
jgi:hypothetical protein